MAEIKEEIIEFNEELGLITRYTALVECASATLSGLIQTWNTWLDEEEEIVNGTPKPKACDAKREWFIPEKLGFYFYQAMCAVQYCHQKNIFYSDMKGPNLLIFRNQEVKLGDLGISVKMKDKDVGPDDNVYKGKGVTPGYVTAEYSDSIEQDYMVSQNVMFECDLFALKVTF